MATGLYLSNELLVPPPPCFWRRWLAWLSARANTHAPLPCHTVGCTGEELAYWCLRQHGYTIVARNYARQRHAPGLRGELDLVAWEGSPAQLVFVEVKTRTRQTRYLAENAVDAAKRRHLVRAARAFRWRRGYRGPFRFDVVVVYGPETQAPRVHLHRRAFYG